MKSVSRLSEWGDIAGSTKLGVVDDPLCDRASPGPGQLINDIGEIGERWKRCGQHRATSRKPEPHRAARGLFGVLIGVDDDIASAQKKQNFPRIEEIVHEPHLMLD